MCKTGVGGSHLLLDRKRLYGEFFYFKKMKRLVITRQSEWILS